MLALLPSSPLGLVGTPLGLLCAHHALFLGTFSLALLALPLLSLSLHALCGSTFLRLLTLDFSSKRRLQPSRRLCAFVAVWLKGTSVLFGNVTLDALPRRVWGRPWCKKAGFFCKPAVRTKVATHGAEIGDLVSRPALWSAKILHLHAETVMHATTHEADYRALGDGSPIWAFCTAIGTLLVVAMALELLQGFGSKHMGRHIWIRL
mmetsp:Transcript_145042/g.270389  ORF Transcript_145042/g.270389 Transcript_145042/m.270389 type:complete len:206 (-) Transcript_145042:452-1069(-)